MTQTERRTLDELLARYDLEPSLSDVYVEGTFDREVLERCFKNWGQTDRIAYEIDSVEIPADLVRKERLTDGNKQRLLVLARALASIEHEIACRCLVDRDLDHWFGPLEVCRNLIWTEHCSIELYFFTEEQLQDLLIVAARTKIGDWPAFLSSMTNILIDLYCMRLVDRELDWSMDWLPLRKHLEIEDASLTFNLGEYVSRLLAKNRRAHSKADFDAALAKWRSRTSGDPRSTIRGHDLLEMLSWVIRAFKGLKELATTVAIERIFLLSAPSAPGLQELFQALGND